MGYQPRKSLETGPTVGSFFLCSGFSMTLLMLSRDQSEIGAPANCVDLFIIGRHYQTNRFCLLTLRIDGENSVIIIISVD